MFQGRSTHTDTWTPTVIVVDTARVKYLALLLPLALLACDGTCASCEPEPPYNDVLGTSADAFKSLYGRPARITVSELQRDLEVWEYVAGAEWCRVTMLAGYVNHVSRSGCLPQ